MSRFPRSRPAFTLIEIMVVLTIMAALAALTASAVMGFIRVQQNSNTQSTLDRVESVLAKNWSVVKDAALKESINSDTYAWIQANLAGSDANAAGRVRVIYIKLKLRQAFPMNFNEALFPPFGTLPTPGPCPCSQLQPLAGYKSYLASHNIGLSSGFAWESSACLLMALQRGVGGAQMNPAELTAGGAGGVDDQGFGVPVLNDAWGRPIYFSRVPAGCPTLNPPSPTAVTTVLASGGACYAQPKANDPGDPEGYLQSPAWLGTYGGLFQSDTLQLMAPVGYSYKLAPMVASGGAGRTGQPGFDPVTFAPLPGSSVLYAKQ